MKTIYLTFYIAIILFVSAAGFQYCNAPGHKTAFTISVTSTAIIMNVTYNPDQAQQVENYIDSCLQPEVVFGDKHKANKEVQINSSQLNYFIKGSPGTLIMTADKKSNADSSLNKLKNIFEGLKTVIKPT